MYDTEGLKQLVAAFLAEGEQPDASGNSWAFSRRAASDRLGEHLIDVSSWKRRRGKLVTTLKEASDSIFDDIRRKASVDPEKLVSVLSRRFGLQGDCDPPPHQVCLINQSMGMRKNRREEKREEERGWGRERHGLMLTSGYAALADEPRGPSCLCRHQVGPLLRPTSTRMCPGCLT